VALRGVNLLCSFGGCSLFRERGVLPACRVAEKLSLRGQEVVERCNIVLAKGGMFRSPNLET